MRKEKKKKTQIDQYEWKLELLFEREITKWSQASLRYFDRGFRTNRINIKTLSKSSSYLCKR